jgi:hypothetical protein
MNDIKLFSQKMLVAYLRGYGVTLQNFFDLEDLKVAVMM